MRHLIYLLALLTACGTAPPETIGDFCADVAPITCTALAECVGDVPANCEDEFVAACCGEDGNCATPTREISRGDYNDCLNDLEDRSCAAWADGAAFPSSCQTL